MSAPSRPTASDPPLPVTLGIALASVGVLMQEVLLTRIFSFTIWYHLAYLTISTALLGFGAAGTILTLFPRFVSGHPRRFSALCAAGAGVALLLSMAVLGPRPISPDDLIDEPATFFLQLLGYYAVVSVPFLLGGLAVATPLAAWPSRVNRLYAADLAGAGLGCLAAVMALSFVDGPAAVAWCAATLLAAGACYAAPGRLALALGAAALLAGAASPTAERLLEFRPTGTKTLAAALENPNTEVLFTRWSPVNRVDLYRIPGFRGGFWATYGRPRTDHSLPPPVVSVVYDAHNGSDAYRVTNRESLALLDDHLLATPYLFHEHPRVLVIGVGGGIDILNAVYHGAEKVIGVELQPITVELHRGLLAQWTGGWMARPEVELVAAEGRHYVRSHDERYDILQITAVDTFSAQTTGAYVLAESYLYTVEAFDDYLSKLDDDGMISIVIGDLFYNDPSVPTPFSTRLANMAWEALRRRGVEDPSQHILLTGQGIPDLSAPREQLVAGGWVQNLIVKKTPFSADEMRRLRAFAGPRDFKIRLAPDDGPGDPVIEGIVRAPPERRQAVLDEQIFNLGTISDDRPFFFNVLPWREIVLDRRIEWTNPGSATGQLVLLMMLGQALVLGGVLIALPLLRGAGASLPWRPTAGFLLYFTGLGLGFLLIEISFVQKYVLLLGYPTYSLSVTIFSLLVFSALGAALSRRGWGRPRRMLGGLLAATLTLLALEVWALPWVRETCLAAPLALRFAVTASLQLPLGLVLGMYFPTGLELLRRREPRLVPWAWAVNGVASVAASVLAVLLGMAIGFSGVALVAGAIYTIGTLSLLTVLGRETPLPGQEVDPSVG